MSSFSLHKTERISAQKHIDALFGKESAAMVAYGFRFSWILLPAPAQTCAVLFISSKKKLKTAVERNQRKRLLRELYRLNKNPLLDFLLANELRLALSLNYVGMSPLKMKTHEPAFVQAINKLILAVQKNHTSTLPAAH